MELPENIVQLLNEPSVTKVLGIFTDQRGLCLSPLQLIKVPSADIVLLPQHKDMEMQDSLAAAMASGQIVSILCLSNIHDERQAYQILCAAREYQTAGPLYEKFLDELRVDYSELQGVWVLEPLEVNER